MDIAGRCQEIRTEVEGALAAAADEEARAQALVQGLYLLSDTLFAVMGKPSRSQSYLNGREAALDLIVSLSLPLVRRKRGARELVTVLVEVAQACPDPVLEKKLSGYARQLLAQEKRQMEPAPGERSGRTWWFAGAAVGSLAMVGYLLFSLQPPQRSAVVSREGMAQRRSGDPVPQGALVPPHPVLASREGSGATAEGAKRSAPRPERGEQVTRIKIVASQVLVPVTVRNGSETLKVTLLLDTGSTRTALGEQFAARLGIDLGRATPSLVEVADGRVLQAKLATVDQVSVGGRSIPSFEVEFFPYSGSDQGFDGFLGMDFLGRQRYQVDVENEVIRWF